MPNSINYATQFLGDIMQKYSRELLTADLMYMVTLWRRKQ